MALTDEICEAINNRCNAFCIEMAVNLMDYRLSEATIEDLEHLWNEFKQDIYVLEVKFKEAEKNEENPNA